MRWDWKLCPSFAVINNKEQSTGYHIGFLSRRHWMWSNDTVASPSLSCLPFLIWILACDGRRYTYISVAAAYRPSDPCTELLNVYLVANQLWVRETCSEMWRISEGRMNVIIWDLQKGGVVLLRRNGRGLMGWTTWTKIKQMVVIYDLIIIISLRTAATAISRWLVNGQTFLQAKMGKTFDGSRL